MGKRSHKAGCVFKLGPDGPAFSRSGRPIGEAKGYPARAPKALPGSIQNDVRAMWAAPQIGETRTIMFGKGRRRKGPNDCSHLDGWPSSLVSDKQPHKRLMHQCHGGGVGVAPLGIRDYCNFLQTARELHSGPAILSRLPRLRSFHLVQQVESSNDSILTIFPIANNFVSPTRLIDLYVRCKPTRPVQLEIERRSVTVCSSNWSECPYLSE